MYVVLANFFMLAFSSFSILNCTFLSTKNFSQSSFIFLFSNTIRLICLNPDSSLFYVGFFLVSDPIPSIIVLLLPFEKLSLI